MNEHEMAAYRRWLRHAGEDEAVMEELKSLANNETALSGRFSADLSFGTSGMRALMGAGSSRMNIFTVRKATQGLASALNARWEAPSVAIAYDSRHNSRRFAEETACVLAGNGVRAWLYPTLMPTPALSFAVRALKCKAGVMITASHNPRRYNGYKVYGASGGQPTDKTAKSIEQFIRKTDIFADIRRVALEAGLASGLIRYIGPEVEQAYLDAVSALGRKTDRPPRSAIVYTPLNGTGLSCVTRILAQNGFSNVTVVPEQRDPNGDFPSCPTPNPELPATMAAGMALGREMGADLLIATDPDCDRIGLAVKAGADMRLLSGHEIGALMLEYICRRHTEEGTMPDRPVVVTSIVSTLMVEQIAKRYGVLVRRVPVGFKYIGEIVTALEEKEETERFLFGFEESNGVLTGAHVREKDGVNGALTAAQMAEYYRERGMTLGCAMDELYRAYGYYQNDTDGFAFPGASGAAQMKACMERLRAARLQTLGDQAVECFIDYRDGVAMHADGRMEYLNLPASNGLRIELGGHTAVTIRLSGTEPKLKLYYAVYGQTQAEAQAAMERLKAAVKELLNEKTE